MQDRYPDWAFQVCVCVNSIILFYAKDITIQLNLKCTHTHTHAFVYPCQALLVLFLLLVLVFSVLLSPLDVSMCVRVLMLVEFLCCYCCCVAARVKHFAFLFILCKESNKIRVICRIAIIFEKLNWQGKKQI